MGAHLTSTWTGLALVLIVFSLPCRQAHYRYAGLAVFALAIGRAFLEINSTLTGFNKAAAFAALCFVLLVVAYGYHRPCWFLPAAPRPPAAPTVPRNTANRPGEQKRQPRRESRQRLP